MNAEEISVPTRKQRKAQLRVLQAQQGELADKQVQLTEAIDKLKPSKKTEVTQAKTEKAPAPSGTTVETSQLVRSIGAVIIAGGIIALLIWQFGGAELLQLLLYVALPLLALFAAFKLISYGTLQLIWNSDMDSRVNTYMRQLKGTPATA